MTATEHPPSLGEPDLRRADKDAEYGYEVWSLVCTTCGKQWFGKAWESCPGCVKDLEAQHGRFDGYQSSHEEPPPPPREAESEPDLRCRLLTVGQLAALPPPLSLVAGLIDLDNISMLYGPRGGRKSFVALDIGLCIAAGIPWHGRDVHQGIVVYVAAEGSSGLAQRIDAWQRLHRDADVGARFLALPEPVNLLSPGAVAQLTVACAEVRPVLVVIDTLARSMVGGDENTVKDAGLAVAAMDQIRRSCGGNVLVIHHAGKDSTRGARGSSALEGAADTVLEVGSSDDIVTIRTTKQKNRPEGHPIQLRAEPCGPSLVLTPYRKSGEDITPKVARALVILHEIAGPIGASMTGWTEAAAEENIGSSTVKRTRIVALEQGWIGHGPSSTDRHPQYVLTDLGRTIAGIPAETRGEQA